PRSGCGHTRRGPSRWPGTPSEAQPAPSPGATAARLRRPGQLPAGLRAPLAFSPLPWLAALSWSRVHLLIEHVFGERTPDLRPQRPHIGNRTGGPKAPRRWSPEALRGAPTAPQSLIGRGRALGGRCFV